MKESGEFGIVEEILGQGNVVVGLIIDEARKRPGEEALFDAVEVVVEF